MSEVKQKPNIRFCGKPQKNHEGKKDIESEPFDSIANDTENYELPSHEEQRKGFYHKNAAQIVRLFPDRYKFVVEKGKK